MLRSLKSGSERYQPILEEVKPQEWMAKGAPEAYVKQLKALRDEIGYLQQTADELSKKPDRTTKALEAYLRLQSVNSMMDSIVEGVRRYQNPAVADLLEGIMNENGDIAQQLRDYLVELVASKENECRIANEEAQRCRATLINRPAAHPGATGRKKQE